MPLQCGCTEQPTGGRMAVQAEEQTPRAAISNVGSGSGRGIDAAR